jgi:hypothetical protein
MSALRRWLYRLTKPKSSIAPMAHGTKLGNLLALRGVVTKHPGSGLR